MTFKAVYPGDSPTTSERHVETETHHHNAHICLIGDSKNSFACVQGMEYDLDKVRQILDEKKFQVKTVMDALSFSEILFSGSKQYGNTENILLKSYITEKERQIGELTQLKKELEFEIEFLQRTWEEETIKALYRSMVYRNPEPTGLNYWAASLRSSNVKNIVVGIVSSIEYKEKNMRTPEETVKNAYKTILGRDVESEKLHSEVENVKKLGNVPYVLALVRSEEYAQKFGDNSVPRKL